jgi:hypothetical protein
MSNCFLAFTALGLLLAPGAPPPAPSAAGKGTSGLVIECPPTAKFFCPGSTDPSATGFATAVTSCQLSPNVTITYVDAAAPTTGCPADRFHANVLRTWTATDACGNSTSCVQEIHVLRQIWNLDILPATCPNDLETNIGPSTVVMGLSGAFGQNVAAIVPGSIRVYTEDCASGPVAPTNVTVADMSRPFFGPTCGCGSLGADGILDLKLTFDRGSLVNGLGLGSMPAGTNKQLIVTGNLSDGCSFVAVDCVQVRHSAGNQGCSHGYWKNHLSSWGPTGFAPNADFDTVFGVNAFTPDRTLLQALKAGGGGVNNLGRQGVAALLDAAHPGVAFPLSTAQVITMVQGAVNGGNVNAVASQLDTLVNLGCPLN